MTDEEFERRLDLILENHQSEEHSWYYWHEGLSPFVIAKSICILARAINGGEP